MEAPGEANGAWESHVIQAPGGERLTFGETTTYKLAESIYLTLCDDEKIKGIFNRASREPEMGEELQLIRTVMASQTGDVAANSKKISDYLLTFLRLTGQHHKQREGASDVNAMLDEIAENTRKALRAQASELTQGALALEPYDPAGSDPDEDTAGPPSRDIEEGDTDEIP